MCTWESKVKIIVTLVLKSKTSSLGNKELLQERRFSKRSTHVDKCCQGPNILSCTPYNVDANIVRSQTKEISIHGYKLEFLRKVQPNGFVYKNDIGDEAVVSIRENF